MRERGLKLILHKGELKERPVAPHAGAWVETFIFISHDNALQSLPMRERGLKLLVLSHGCSPYSSRSPCGSVG